MPSLHSLPLRSTTLLPCYKSSVVDPVPGRTQSNLRKRGQESPPNFLYITYARSGRNVSLESYSTFAVWSSKQETCGCRHSPRRHSRLKPRCARPIRYSIVQSAEREELPFPVTGPSLTTDPL